MFALTALLLAFSATPEEVSLCKAYVAPAILNVSSAPANAFKTCLMQGNHEAHCSKIERILARASADTCAQIEQVETISPHNSSSCHCNFVKATECAAAIAGCAVACGVTGGAACVACLDIIPGCCNCACKAFGCDCAKDC